MSASKRKTNLEEIDRPWASLLKDWLGEGSISSANSCDRWDSAEPLLGILSSHDSSFAYAHSDWQRRLLAACRFATEQRYRVFFSADTPYSEAIRNACEHLDLPFLVISQSGGSNRYRVSRSASGWSLVWESEYSSELDSLRELPFADRLIAALANSLFVLHLRKGGRLEKVLRARLNEVRFQSSQVYLSLSHPSTPSGNEKRHRQAVQDWLDRGAIGWICDQKEADSKCSLLSIDLPCHRAFGSTTVPVFPAKLLPAKHSTFLVHCTRARRGPWPDQSVEQFHDEIFQSPWRCEPTVLQSLQRILSQRKIIATSWLKPGQQATVSLSSAPWSEITRSRCFERHVAKWDWEPYGLMIDRQWLIHRNAKPVVYLTRDQMKRTPSEDLVYAQVYSEDGPGRDWRREQEWRIADDIRLHELPFSKGIVFVPTWSDAKQIEHLSQWPIAVLEDN